MIDTDKSEGHTPAPWDITNDGIVGVTEPENVTLHIFSGCYSETDAQLIADAPLLLAEVKRHRPPKVDGKYMAWSDSHPKHDRRTWIEQVMEGITDVGYWTWVNWQLQYGDEEE